MGTQPQTGLSYNDLRRFPEDERYVLPLLLRRGDGPTSDKLTGFVLLVDDILGPPQEEGVSPNPSRG